MGKFLKINSEQAKKIAGKYDDFNALDPVFIQHNDSTGEDEFITPPLEELGEVFDIAKRYLQKELDKGSIKIIDSLESNDIEDYNKALQIQQETDIEVDARIKTRVTKKWDYTKIVIKEEL